MEEFGRDGLLWLAGSLPAHSLFHLLTLSLTRLNEELVVRSLPLSTLLELPVPLSEWNWKKWWPKQQQQQQHQPPRRLYNDDDDDDDSGPVSLYVKETNHLREINSVSLGSDTLCGIT